MPDRVDVEHAKRELRVRMRVVRAAIAADPDSRRARSEAIRTSVTGELGRRAVASVMLYRPLPTEPDVEPIAHWCAERGQAVYGPEVDGDALRVMPGDIDPALLDAVLVPGLAFTADGHRLGQGGGHFDRFLPRLRDDCLRIGIAFREQLVDTIPLADHDATVDLVITA